MLLFQPQYITFCIFSLVRFHLATQGIYSILIRVNVKDCGYERVKFCGTKIALFKWPRNLKILVASLNFLIY